MRTRKREEDEAQEGRKQGQKGRAIEGGEGQGQRHQEGIKARHKKRMLSQVGQERQDANGSKNKQQERDGMNEKE